MGMILVDSSVWIGHMQKPNDALAEYLEAPQALMHPLVLGELVCGMFARRDTQLRMWRSLPQAPLHPHDAVIDWIESERLMGRGIGFIDAHLLYSTIHRSETRLWTADKRLEALALRFGVAHPSPD